MHTVNDHYRIVVIGGGQAGLVTGYYLKLAGLDFVILDANDNIGGSWQHYYESLHLFSPAKYGELPGLKFPGDPKHYPSKYEVIEYLRRYAKTHELPIESGVRVARVEKNDGIFLLHTQTGTVYKADAVISATGPFNTPYMPNLPKAEQFSGTRLHSFNYRRPEPYAGQHVVVIGARDSAMQIAYDLIGHARVSMAARHELKFTPKYVLGKSIFWWLHDTGYDQLPLGLFKQLEGSPKIIGREPYQTALKNGNPTVRPMFTEFTAEGVVWGDGEREAVDTVIYATGYRPGLDYLAPLGALDDNGFPCHRAGVSETVEGLYYVGLFGQRSHASATLRGVGKDAAYIVEAVADYLKSWPAAIPQTEAAMGE